MNFNKIITECINFHGHPPILDAISIKYEIVGGETLLISRAKLHIFISKNT